MSSLSKARDWYPADLLQGRTTRSYGVIVLNQPINGNALNAVVQNAVYLVCADAGGNRLMDYELSGKYHNRKPDAIVGDLDSLTTIARDHYRQQGVQIVHDPDQYSTDFTKSLKWMRKQWEDQHSPDQELDVVVMGGLGGRVDQGFSQVHHLYMALNSSELLNGAIYLLSEQSLSFVLDAHENLVHVNRTVFAENVGIIPVLGLTLISTSGLEWDVFNWPSEIGGQVSTSNHIRSDLIKVSAHGPRPLFTLELVPSLCEAGVN